METSGIVSLGINLKSIVAQIINFALLFWLLKIVAYGPIIKILEDRRKTIKNSIDNTQKIERELKDLQEKKAEVLAKAQNDAEKNIKEARTAGEKIKAEILAEAKKEQKKLAEKTKRELVEEKEKIIADAAQYIGSIAAKLSAKIIKKNLDANKNQEIIEKNLKMLEKKSE